MRLWSKFPYQHPGNSMSAFRGSLDSQILRNQVWWVVFIHRIDVVGSDESAVWMKKANFEMFAWIAVALMPPRSPVTFEHSLLESMWLCKASNLPDNRPCNISLRQAQHYIVHVDSIFSQYTPIFLCSTSVNIIPYDDFQRHCVVWVQRLCGLEKDPGMSQLKSVEFEWRGKSR